MRWTRGRLAALAGVAVLAVVAVGVDRAAQPPTALRSSSQADASATVSPSRPSPRPSPRTAPAPSPRTAPARPGAAVPTLPRPRGAGTAAAPSATAAVPPAALPTLEPPVALEFTLGTFNMLGASHTSRRGNHPGFETGTVRARRAAALLAGHRVDVVGLQELQGSQLRALRRHSDLAFYPGSALAPRDSENSVAWRRDRWVAVERHAVRIPYFDGGPRAVPVVRLRSRSTGLEAWFVNVHNPAETHRFHHQQRFRARATLIEARLVDALMDRTHLPVFLTGDMNERAAFFCRLTARAPMVAARGGSNTGRCRPGAPRGIDWIFGSQGVQFTGYREDDSHRVDLTSDHPLVTARVRVVGQPSG